MYLAHTHTRKEHARSVKNENETWTTKEGQNNQQITCERRKDEQQY